MQSGAISRVIATLRMSLLLAKGQTSDAVEQPMKRYRCLDVYREKHTCTSLTPTLSMSSVKTPGSLSIVVQSIHFLDSNSCMSAEGMLAF